MNFSYGSFVGILGSEHMTNTLQIVLWQACYFFIHRKSVCRKIFQIIALNDLYITGYKLDGRTVNGTMSGGLWIERGPWGSSSGTTDDKSDATPEKLLNLNATPGDYAEVDGPVAPLMPPGSQAPGTPVAYATTNIIRGRNVSLNHLCWLNKFMRFLLHSLKFRYWFCVVL